MHKLEWFLSRKVSLGSSRGTMMLSAVVPMQISLVFSAAGGLEDYAENATVGLLNYHTIKNGFYLVTLSSVIWQAQSIGNSWRT